MKLNLLPKEEKIALEKIRILHIANFYSLGVNFLLIIFAAVFFAIDFYAGLELNLLKKILESEKMSAEYQKIIEEEREIGKTLIVLKNYENNKKELKSLLPALEKISVLIPQGVVLKSFSLNLSGQANIAGFSPDRSRVKDIETALKSDPSFANVVSPASNFLKPTNIDFKFSFNIK